MAELDQGMAEPLADDPALDEDTGAPQDSDAALESTDDGTSEDQLGDEPPADPTDPNYKYWQGAYTKARQRDRAQVSTIQQQHKEFGDVLRNFHTDDAYALNVLRHRFPHLAAQLSLDGQAASGRSPQLASNGTSSKLEGLLTERLGPDLQFLAPKLAGALEAVLQETVDAAVSPLKQETQSQQAAARKREEDTLLAAMDEAHPGWDARYGEDMKALDAFLASDALTHPKFGNRYELLFRLANPGQARIEATRRMQTAARSRLTTGRTGRPSQPNTDEDVRKAPTNADAFRLAAEAALRTVRSGA